MAKKTIKDSMDGIESLPNDKPVVYWIKSRDGTTNYVGVAQKGQVTNRLKDHLPQGKDHVPGSVIKVEQMSSIAGAKAKEARVISRVKPKYNKRGK